MSGIVLTTLKKLHASVLLSKAGEDRPQLLYAGRNTELRGCLLYRCSEVAMPHHRFAVHKV